MERYLKAIVAALIPVLNAVLLWAVTGELNAPELATALSGLIVALLVYLIPNSQVPRAPRVKRAPAKKERA